jgi:peptidoglycan/LPS O-acetylase OafA/YrhL
MYGKRVHLRSLTGFRFFAAIAVVFYHLSLYFDPPLGHALDAFSYGFTGVSFFFILSGFVLTWSHQRGDSARKFYWNRFARVWPLHALTTLLAIFVPPLTTPTTVWPALPFVLTLTQTWIPGSGYAVAFNGVSWSLACEAIFYLLFPLLIGRLGSHRRLFTFAGTVFAAILIVGIEVSLSTSAPVATYLLGTMPLYRLGEFVLGICLALKMRRGWRAPISLGRAICLSAFLYASLIVVSFVTSGSSGSVPVTFANLTMIPGFLALIAAAATNDLLGKSSILSDAKIVRLGQWSFALYLAHELVIRLARPLIEEMAFGPAVAASVFVVVGSVAVSGTLHEFVEKPLERRLRSLANGRKFSAGRMQDQPRP